MGTGLAMALSRRNLAHRIACRTPLEGCVAVGDIDETTDWSAAVKGASSIIHLAGIAHQAAGRLTLDQYRRVNVAGTLRLAVKAAAAGVQRIVFVSSVGVLGEVTAPGERLSELSPAKPQSSYAQSKHEAELALTRFCRLSNMELVIVRPPLVYGREAKGNFGRLVKLVASDWPLPFGSIRNRRSMIALPNLVEALVECATNPAAANETFMVAEAQAVSTAEVVGAIAAGLRKKPRMLHVPPGLLAQGLKVAGRSAMVNGLLESLEIDSRKISEKTGWTERGSTLDNITTAVSSYTERI